MDSEGLRASRGLSRVSGSSWSSYRPLGISHRPKRASPLMKEGPIESSQESSKYPWLDLLQPGSGMFPEDHCRHRASCCATEMLQNFDL